MITWVHINCIWTSVSPDGLRRYRPPAIDHCTLHCNTAPSQLERLLISLCVARSVLATDCDRQTDGRTDRQTVGIAYSHWSTMWTGLNNATKCPPFWCKTTWSYSTGTGELLKEKKKHAEQGRTTERTRSIFIGNLNLSTTYKWVDWPCRNDFFMGNVIYFGCCNAVYRKFGREKCALNT